MKEKPELKCVYCGCVEELFLTTDHIKPACRGGRATPDNVQWTCWLCNQLKGLQFNISKWLILEHIN